MIGTIPSSAPWIEPIGWFLIACVVGAVLILAVIAVGVWMLLIGSTGRQPSRSDRSPRWRNWR